MPEIKLKSHQGKGVSIFYGYKSLRYKIPDDYPYTGTVTSTKVSPSIITYCNTSTVNQESSKAIKITWPEKDNSFTQENYLYDEDNQVKELIFLIKNTLAIEYRYHLANKLLKLFNYAKEEDPDSPGINIGSLRNFYNFLQLNSTLKYPLVSLTPDNNIYAKWTGDQNRLFAVHFLSNRNIRYVLFSPNVRYPDQVVRISGTITSDILFDSVSPFHVKEWISE